MTSAAARAAQAVKAKYGLNEGDPKFGTYCHTALRDEIERMGGNVSGEVSYKLGKPDQYGSGSVRLDVVKGSKDAPEAIYDLKTGTAEHLSEERIQQIRANLPPASRNIPIIEIRLNGTVIHY